MCFDSGSLLFLCRLPTLEDGSINERLLASIGNGHIATTVLTDSIFMDGLYNGKLGKP